MEGLTFSLYGIGGAILVTALLEGLKAVWKDANGEPVIQDRWAVIAALVIGVALSILAQLAQDNQALARWLQAVLAGLMAGLSACGVFSLVKRRSN